MMYHISDPRVPQLLTQLGPSVRGRFWGGHAAAGADRDRAVVKGTAAELPMEKGRDHGAGIQEQHGLIWGFHKWGNQPTMDGL